VTKGVETKDQLIFLQALHCDEIQGYFAHRPLTMDAMTRTLS
jgi:EAL domain-containing protein (putative c-di-GMP-specific phosphodiesterase class I)